MREKARIIVELLNSGEQLTAERDKARANKNKYSGTSSESQGFSGGGGGPREPEARKGFSDEDFKFSSERGREPQGGGLTSMMSSMYNTATEYAAAANKQLASMQTIFPSNELDRKLSEATSNEPGTPSSSLLYELGKASHRATTTASSSPPSGRRSSAPTSGRACCSRPSWCSRACSSTGPTARSRRAST